ncbi:MAG: tRNA pseudouridine(55) synthase TruB [Clostridia bacterium]|nr:tRNA pseudouridine(55) synthase TruB [Clostridia bacterium]
MNGLFLVDKPTDMTSFGVVARLRRLTREKCGHSGTLDPMATGLLPVMVGKGTKLCELFTEGRKGYIGTLRFGLCTDTGDTTGEVLEERPGMPSEAELLTLLPRFTGRITQRPPAYSAIKVNGVPLYKLARKGKEAEAPLRTVEIHRLELVEYRPETQEAVLEVECSKGTYIRSLFMDLAAAAGCLGTMSALRRTRSGRFSVEDAVPLEELMILLEQGDAEQHFISLEKALETLPTYQPEAFFATLLKNGCEVEKKKLKKAPETLCTVYQGDVLLGLGNTIEKDGEILFKIVTHL